MVKAACKRKLTDMAEIDCINNNWELMSNNSAYQENEIVEFTKIKEGVEDFLEEY